MWVMGQAAYEYSKHSALFQAHAVIKPALASKYRKNYDSSSIGRRNRPVIGIVAANEATASNSGRPIVLHVDTGRL